MANSLSLLLINLFIPFLVSTLRTSASAITQTTSTAVAKDEVPCTMCSECENPCQPLPPPPPPVIIECPPPPPPPSPPPPPPPTPAVVIECPPPPKPSSSSSCPDNCMPWLRSPYFPPGMQFPDHGPYDYKNNGAKLIPFAALRFSSLSACSLIVVILLCLPH